MVTSGLEDFRMLIYVASGLLAVILIIYYSLLLPPRHPENIPSIPFWVLLISFIKEVDQEDTYRRYLRKPLETHGAVKLFFGARWNILVQRPLFIAQIFKEEEVFQKSGNQEKIPYSVLAEFLGDNIISSHGENWKLYRGIVKPGLQRNFEVEPIFANATFLCNLIEQSQASRNGTGLAVQELLQRYTIANVSESLLQTDLETLKSVGAPLNVLQSAVKREIFKPIYLNFPFLDKLPIPSRVRARDLVSKFSNELVNGLEKSYESQHCSLKSDKLGSRLLAARDNGTFSTQQFRDNLNVTFVAGQENPQLLLVSTLYLLAKDQMAQTRLRQEICGLSPEIPTQSEFQNLPYLTSVIYESLRLFPPISQLINRRASIDTFLGNDIFIPRGTYLGYNCYSTHRDPHIWGDTADEFRPERWGSLHGDIMGCVRRAKAQAEFLSFHGGKRACLGEKFAVLEMRISLMLLLRRFEWTLDPTWPDRKTPAGPLYPQALRLIFSKLPGIHQHSDDGYGT